MKTLVHDHATREELRKRIPTYTDSPIVISVAGGSCVGKTSTILRYLKELLGDSASFISIDNFQYGEDFKNKKSSIYRWDDPENFALSEIVSVLTELKENKEVKIPVFNLEKNKRVGTQSITPNKYIVVEGIYAFYGELETISDLKIYLETPYYGRLLRRVFRFTLEDKIDKPEVPVRHMTGPTYKAHVDHVVKQKDTADLRITMPYEFTETFNKFNLINTNLPFEGNVDEIYFCSPEGVTIGRSEDTFVIEFNKQTLFHTRLDKQILNQIKYINFCDF